MAYTACHRPVFRLGFVLLLPSALSGGCRGFLAVFCVVNLLPVCAYHGVPFGGKAGGGREEIIFPLLYGKLEEFFLGDVNDSCGCLHHSGRRVRVLAGAFVFRRHDCLCEFFDFGKSNFSQVWMGEDRKRRRGIMENQI